MGAPPVGLAVVRAEERRSCTRTMPSYHPETTIWSEAPHGEDMGADSMAYTAEGRSICEPGAKSVEG